MDTETMLLEVGATGKITVSINPSNATNKKVNWSSSDETVATVDANGVVTAVASGEAIITATSADNVAIKAECKVTVAIDWSELADAAWYGEGTEDTYTINTAAELAGLAKLVKSGTNFSGKTINLGADIDLLNLEWIPIGTKENPFRGKFNGADKEISNLKIDAPEATNVGLFGYVTGGSLSNLKLKDVEINAKEAVGALVGNVRGLSEPISNIEGRFIDIQSTHWAGGLIGYSYASVKDCSVDEANVTLTYDTSINDNGDKAGGITGYQSEGNFYYENCRTSNVEIVGVRDVGGLVGASQYDVLYINCHVEFSVITADNSSFEHDQPYAGGLIGRAAGSITLYDCTATPGGIIDDVFVPGVIVSSYKDGFAGELVGGPASNVTIAKVLNSTQRKGYETIQAAIDAAQGGDTILVGDGEYTENLTINKAITLKSLNGRESTEIAGTITITADDVTVEGFTVTAQGYYAVPVIHMIDIDNVNILNNTVVADDTAYGAIGTSSAPAKITGKISGNTVTGMIMVGTDGAVEVSNNNVTLTTASTEGICFYPVGSTAEITVKGNTVGPVTGDNVHIKVNEKPLSVNGANSELDMLAAITADNNEATAKLGWFTLADSTVAVIGATQYDSLREAVNVANNSKAEVIMIADVTIAGGSGGYGVAGLVLNGAIINGNGNTLTVTGANDTWNCAIYTTGGTIKNLTVGGAFRGIFTAGCSEDIIIDNVVLDNVCYTFSSDGSNPDYSVIVTNSTLNGWTSFTSGYKSVSFNDCIFGKGTGGYQYAYMRPYSDTAFSNCAFSEGYELDATRTDDITLYNCTVGGVKLTQDNLTTLLGANAAKAKVLTIEDDVYYYGTTLYGLTNEFTGTTLTVREGTTVIGAGALQDNSTIEEVVLPDGLITIEANAFKRCTNLETINLPNSLTSIGDQAFQQCSGLTRIIIPNSVTAIGKQAYYACTSVTELVIPEGVITIGIGAFRELAITEVTIPSTVTSLGSFAFRDCKQLRTVYFNCESAPEITTTGTANGQVFRVMDGSGNVVIKVTKRDVYDTVTAESYAFRGCYIDDSHHVSCVYTEQVVEGVLLTGTKTYEIISKAGLMNLDTVLAGADLGEGKAATINLAVDVDLSGETWTPISRMWFTFNGNGHTISNLTTESTRKAGLFGYAGAVTVNDLTLENVTVTGSQAGVFAGAGEDFTANNCFLKGTNTVNFTPTEETWNGIGAITGVLLNGTVNVTIDEDATVTLNRGDMTTAEGCVYVDDLTGHITTNKGTVKVNGTVVATGSYAHTAAEDTVETQQDVADTVEEEIEENTVEEIEDPNEQETEDDEEIVDEQVDTEENTDNGLEGEGEAVDEEDAA